MKTYGDFETFQMLKNDLVSLFEHNLLTLDAFIVLGTAAQDALKADEVKKFQENHEKIRKMLMKYIQPSQNKVN